MTSRAEFVRTKQVQLDKWNYAIDTMSAKADKVSGAARYEYNEQIVLLVSMQAIARQKIKKLQEAGDSLWKEMKPDVELTWADMAKLMDSAGHHFR